MMKPKVIVIVGPTASGKSDLAVRLAKRFNGEVVSADARQVYKGLDIGTAKITKREMQNVPHHLLDVADPKHIFSAAEYKEKAEKALEVIRARKRIPIIVGGTGFYIDALINGASLPDVPPDPALRKSLSRKTPAELFRMLQKKDPRRAKDIDPHNTHRLIRALEIAQALGKVPLTKEPKRTYQTLFLGIEYPSSELHRRIQERVVARMKKGMVAEARRLHAHGLSYKRMRELGLEYGLLADLLEKKLTRQAFIEGLSAETRKYAKRQMTWFRRNKDTRWFKPTDIREIETEVRAFLV
jgi:tRNA dimethylallyltransferase